MRTPAKGERFGRLTFVRLLGNNRHGQLMCDLKCDCGNVSMQDLSQLLRGRIKSCGCGKLGLDKNRFQTHGRRNTVECQAYHDAKKRCTNPNHKNWKDYGGRGIEFRFKSFEEFYEVLGDRPGPNYSLDRENNDGHYEPGNVRWATRFEQARNQRPPRRRISEVKRAA